MRQRAVAMILFGLGLAGSDACRNGGSRSEAAENVVDVRLIDDKIEMPIGLPPGVTTLRIVNEGAKDHGFTVQGADLDRRLDPLRPDEGALLQVDLRVGSYNIFCEEHKDDG